MKIVTYGLLVIAAALVSANLRAENYSEADLIKLAQGETPSRLANDAAVLAPQVGSAQFNDRFSPELYSNLSHSINREKSTLQPTINDMTNLAVGVRQALPQGMQLSGELFTVQQNMENGPLEESTRTGIRATAKVDLWKNRFGKVDKTQDEFNQSQVKTAEVNKKISDHGFVVDVRKVYWSLVNNRLNSAIRLQLIETSKRQLEWVQNQRRQYIADEADVARYESLVETQSAALLNLSYQKEALIAQLKALLPSLNGKDFDIVMPDVEKAKAQVLDCIAAIEKSANSSQSSYSDLIQQRSDSFQLQSKIDDVYDSPHLAFFTSGEVNGLDNGYDNSFETAASEPMPKITLGLEFSMPLGSRKEKSKEYLKALHKLQLQAQNDSQKALLDSQITRTLQLIKVLQQSFEVQKRSQAINERQLKLSKKRFEQAREPLAIIINDEIALLNSKINSVNIQSQVIATVLDHIKLFDKLDCSFN